MTVEDTQGPAITPLIESTHPLLFELVGDDAPPPFGGADGEEPGDAPSE
jgi:hypothetical protein